MSIVGKWVNYIHRMYNWYEYYEFFSDGKYTYVNTCTNQRLNGTYTLSYNVLSMTDHYRPIEIKLKDDNTLRMDLPSGKQDFTKTR